MMGMAFPCVIGSFSQITGVLWASPLIFHGVGGFALAKVVTYY